MTTGTVRRWLRCEGAAELVFFVTLYWHGGFKWWVFAACFLLPDLSLTAYFGGPILGSRIYNAVHSYVGPALLATISLGRWPIGIAAALIWAAHISFDRMLGYGLKYPTAFGDTHLGRLGKQAALRE